MAQYAQFEGFTKATQVTFCTLLMDMQRNPSITRPKVREQEPQVKQSYACFKHNTTTKTGIWSLRF